MSRTPWRPAVCLLNPRKGTHKCRRGGGLAWGRPQRQRTAPSMRSFDPKEALPGRTPRRNLDLAKRHYRAALQGATCTCHLHITTPNRPRLAPPFFCGPLRAASHVRRASHAAHGTRSRILSDGARFESESRQDSVCVLPSHGKTACVCYRVTARDRVCVTESRQDTVCVLPSHGKRPCVCYRVTTRHRLGIEPDMPVNTQPGCDPTARRSTWQAVVATSRRRSHHGARCLHLEPTQRHCLHLEPTAVLVED